MYSELYEEMEKVRNMLLLQHNINQKQTAEVGGSLTERLKDRRTVCSLYIHFR